MRDFSAAIGLVFAIEGLLLAGFTETMRERMAQAAKTDSKRLRVLDLVAALIGVAIVWATRRIL